MPLRNRLEQSNRLKCDEAMTRWPRPPVEGVIYYTSRRKTRRRSHVGRGVEGNRAHAGWLAMTVGGMEVKKEEIMLI